METPHPSPFSLLSWSTKAGVRKDPAFFPGSFDYPNTLTMELDIMQNPYNNRPLHRATVNGRVGLADDTGMFFPFRNGYPNFLAGQQVTGLNRQVQRFYDSMGRLAGWLEQLRAFLFPFDRRRTEWLRNISPKPGDRVLEVAVGAGCNIRRLPANVRYYGLDISGGMLDRCVRNVRRWGLNLQLSQANAEYLPYCDNTFDSVFHIGGINFFNDRGRAICEMIRVAKPGARVTIIDATAKEIKKQVQRMPFVRRCVCDEAVDRSRLYAPAQFVPEEIRDVEVKLIDNGSMYRLSFVKPINESHKMFLLPNR